MSPLSPQPCPLLPTNPDAHHQASYLQQAGFDTAVVERRHVVGGAAITEEIVPGFKFSRASYVLSLLRPQIYKDLELKKFGLKLYPRDPYSFNPSPSDGRREPPPPSLLLGLDMQENQRSIAWFSARDAKAYAEYVQLMEKLAWAVEPLIDAPPPDVPGFHGGPLGSRLRAAKSFLPALSCVAGGSLHKPSARSFTPKVQGFAGWSEEPILDRWFESEPLKATLATDSVIGAMVSPRTPGSGYVLLHHVMGELEGVKGMWAYVEGGMGAVSTCMAKCAISRGASIFTEAVLTQVLVDGHGPPPTGVVLCGGTEVRSKVVLSNATPHVTFTQLTPQDALPADFLREVSQIDYTSPVTKINVAVDRLPTSWQRRRSEAGQAMAHHRCSIHLNTWDMACLDRGYHEALQGAPSTRPMMELCIPSALDPTLAPPGSHVVSLFTQYTPYLLAGGRAWTQADREAYGDRVFDCIEEYAPGFKSSVIGREILTPADLEREFGLTGGNIFHGAMSLDQLYFTRPVASHVSYRSPVRGLYLCGSGAHPGTGGGVMGSAGRNGALVAVADCKRR
uniref:Pyridine nucleotide-disulfide oxidoreductase domain-containing protein 2 n=1 Tax=Petromyzon marinus TaxID=7757 RepID=A0AAJ7SY28_PETMA|nr:LOW QUALITY PROTEIN: pyridine nucleotide-disulfide oxidoreductase domain-containing protein 2 [Petromyzon marinus]